MIPTFVARAFLSFSVSFSFSAMGALPPDQAAKVQFERAEDGKVYFKAPEGIEAPKPVDTGGIQELIFLGTLSPSAGGYPYFFFTGKPCQDCIEDRAIFSVRPGGGKPSSFVYPGKILDPKSRSLLHESRAFFGHCMSQEGEVLVVYQREKIDRRRYLQESVLVIEPGPTYLEEKLIERRLPRMSHTMKRVKQKQCKEIEGRNRMMTTKTINLRPGENADDEDEEDEEPRQNQTDRDLAPPEAQAPSPGV